MDDPDADFDRGESTFAHGTADDTDDAPHNGAVTVLGDRRETANPVARYLAWHERQMAKYRGTGTPTSIEFDPAERNRLRDRVQAQYQTRLVAQLEQRLSESVGLADAASEVSVVAEYIAATKAWIATLRVGDAPERYCATSQTSRLDAENQVVAEALADWSRLGRTLARRRAERLDPMRLWVDAYTDTPPL